MIAVIAYDLDFDVDHDSDSAHIYADVRIEAVYCFEDKEQAREELEGIRKLHPYVRWKTCEVKQPTVTRAEMDKYQLRMAGDWS